jgi:hypothetical protein
LRTAALIRVLLATVFVVLLLVVLCHG